MSHARPERRKFLRDIGGGMLLAGLGTPIVNELELASADVVSGDAKPLTFGKREPLVRALEETPVEKLLPTVVKKLRSGTTLKELTGAAALANARACGGEDFDAYHAMMALMPAFEMAADLPAERRALPVLKVLHRNSRFIQKYSADHPPRLQQVSSPSANAANVVHQLKKAIKAGEMEQAEQLFAEARAGGLDATYNSLLSAIEDNQNVHRIVLTHRSWELKDLVGDALSETLLRQSVRFCVSREQRRLARGDSVRPTALLLPKLLDEYRLLSKPLGNRKGDDAWVEQLSTAIRDANSAGAAEVVAIALSEGYSIEHVGEAISLAANARVLRDPGRNTPLPGKPVGSVHGGSEGVHACDATNAWRNVARVSHKRNAIASLIVAGYYVGNDDFYEAADGPMNARPFPLADHLAAVKHLKPNQLLPELDSAVRDGDQARACAAAHRYGQLGRSARPVLNVLLESAVRSDGALHAEKFYRTVTEEFQSTRAAFRWRHIVALARVSASQYGFDAPGYDEACDLLGLDA